jgi:hypothetical protein
MHARVATLPGPVEADARIDSLGANQGTRANPVLQIDGRDARRDDGKRGPVGCYLATQRSVYLGLCSGDLGMSRRPVEQRLERDRLSEGHACGKRNGAAVGSPGDP